MSDSTTTLVAELLRQAAAAGRESLDADALGKLLAALGVAFDADAPAGGAEIRITLNATREFGMVIGAGFGGIDAELDEANFKRDRASVYAAAALTDAEDFLRLFKRTLAWQKLAALAKQGGKP
ncbi:MAG TPA: hypothetical protein PLG77_14305, partial [Burkholderiaceae bacterium]|nr:hypothetical protein [Burkholderiaceae bacterium]